MADEKKKKDADEKKKKDDAKETKLRSGNVAYDGDTPVFVIGKNKDGSHVVGRFAAIETTGASLSPNAPEPDDE